MSIEATQAAIAAAAPSHTAKLVMLVLAWHHNGETGLCFPSQERIAAEASLAKSSVVRALKELESAGLITKRKGLRANRKNAPNFYKLIFLTQGSLIEKKRHAGYDRDGRAALPEKEHPTSSQRSEVGKPAKKRLRSQKRAPKRRITEHWRPSKALMQQAADLGFSTEQTERIILDFRDYYIARGEVSASWGMDFGRWLRNQKDFKERDDAREQARERRAGANRRPAGRVQTLRGIARAFGDDDLSGGDG